MNDRPYRTGLATRPPRARTRLRLPLAARQRRARGRRAHRGAEHPTDCGRRPRAADRRSARRGLRRRLSLHHAIACSPGICSRAARARARQCPCRTCFVPACLTPGTTGLMVVHNHPSGDPTPSPDDARLTLRLCAAADVLDMRAARSPDRRRRRPVLQLPRRPARSRRGATET